MSEHGHGFKRKNAPEAAEISDDLHIGGQFGEALLEKRADPGPRRDEGSAVSN